MTSDMARTYRLDAGKRAVNRVYAQLTRWGLGAGHRHLLSVPGRRTGVVHSTPVDVMEVDGRRWLVAPYGETNWVHNVRAHPEVGLRRGRRVESLLAREVAPAEAVPVIRAYVRSVPVTRAYWEVTAEASDAEIEAVTPRHPVFVLSSSR